MHSLVAAPGTWTPKRRGADLLAWLRADLGVSIASGVAAWADQSNNARDFSQGSVPSRLGYSSSDAAYGNRAVVTGTGSGFLDAIAAWTIAQPFTLYVVGEIGNSADWKTLVDSTVAGNRPILRTNPSEQASLYAGSADVTSAVAINAPSIMCAVFNGASSALYLSSTTAAITGNPGSHGIATPRLGRAADGGSSYYLPSDGKIAEVVWTVGADDSSERAQMLRYFSVRYGLAVTGL